MQHVNKKCFFVLELTEMIIMDKINDSEIKNAPPQNGNIANSNKLQNIREIHPIIKNLWFISILNFKLIFHKYFGYDYGAVYKERKTHRIQSR